MEALWGFIGLGTSSFIERDHQGRFRELSSEPGLLRIIAVALGSGDVKKSFRELRIREFIRRPRSLLFSPTSLAALKPEHLQHPLHLSASTHYRHLLPCQVHQHHGSPGQCGRADHSSKLTLLLNCTR